jgi:hypothetical protein
MKRKARSAAAALVITALACLAISMVAVPAFAYVPEDTVEVEEAEDLTAIWMWHGDAELIDDLEKFVIEDNDVRGYAKGMEEIVMVIDGKKYPSGELELEKVITYRAIQAAVSQLWPEDVPVREDFEVVTGDPSTFASGIFEYVTRAVSRDAFELELPEGTSEKKLTAGNYVYKFTNTDSEEEFETYVLEEVWPEDFFELREKVIEGDATSSEIAEFDKKWEEVRETFLTAEEPGDLFFIEEEKETTPAWPIVFTFGLFGLVAVTTVYSVARGKVRGEY